MSLVDQVKDLMKKGIYEPDLLFQIVYRNNRVHYSRVRDAIHVAKGR